jgi:hypothetical protein
LLAGCSPAAHAEDATHVRVSDRPIRLFGRGLTTPYAETLAAITAAFVRAGVGLLDNEGVAFRRRRRGGGKSR